MKIKRNRLNKVLMWDVNFLLQVRTENMHIKHKLSLLFIDQSVVSVAWLGPCHTDLSVDQCPSRPLTSIVFFLFWSTVRANAEPSVCLPLCPSSIGVLGCRALSAGRPPVIRRALDYGVSSSVFQWIMYKWSFYHKKFLISEWYKIFIFTGFMTPASLASCFCVFSTLLDSSIVFLKAFPFVLEKSQGLPALFSWEDGVFLL